MLRGPREYLLRNLSASTVAFRPGSDAGDMTPDPSVDVSAWEEASVLHPDSDIDGDLDKPIDLDGHVLSPFYPREITYQDCKFLSVAHLMCYRYAIINNEKTFAMGIRKWSRPLKNFPTPKFSNTTEIAQCKVVLAEIYAYLCVSDSEIGSALVQSGPRPFLLSCLPPWGGLSDALSTAIGGNLVSDILIETRVQLVAGKLKAPRWLVPVCIRSGLRHSRR